MEVALVGGRIVGRGTECFLQNEVLLDGQVPGRA